MNQKENVLVQSYKYDRTLHYSWQAQLLADDGELLVTYSPPGYLFTHPRLGVRTNMERPQISYFWRHRWFNVNANFSLSGELRNYYCNISLPAEYSTGNPLTWVDLDLDLRVYNDYTHSVLDEDEFILHSQLYNYPLELQTKARDGLAELIGQVKNHQFPFDGSVKDWLKGALDSPSS